ncbi:MAG TPA: glycosyltransferase family 1 protein [Gemmatimonadota bacterium]|nr:glycosyltransferase family 1 protein [Gemmatimonadota bacterium]
MLRALDERGGIGVYTRGILRELLALDDAVTWILYYRDPSNLGRHAEQPNVVERVVAGRHNGLWDQVAIPRACHRDDVDVVFHPKFTVPVVSPCPTVMVLHGADWLIPEQARHYPAANVLAMKVLLPLWCRRATAILSVSELTTDNIIEAVGLPPGKVTTTWFAPARHFRRITDPDRLAEVRQRYDLPEHFIFTLSKPGGGSRKNAGTLFEAFRRLAPTVEHELVVGGRGCEVFRDEYDLPMDGWGARLHFPGWIDQADLPAIYSAADLFLYPSNLEAFPIPLTEAMTCGTPIVTSDANGLIEIAGDAALRVDPTDPAAIADATRSVLGDSELAARLSERGLARSSMFSWDRCARQTLDVLLSAGRGAGGAGGDPVAG